MRLFQFSRISLFTLRRFSTVKNNGLKTQPIQSSQTSQRKRNVKKNLFLQVVELQPKQVLTNEMISNSRRVGVSLASNKNVYDLCAHYQTDVDPRVKIVSLYDFKLYNSQTLIAFDNPFMKLSELSEDVGSISHPLVLAYVDGSIKDIQKYVKIVGLLPNEVLTEDKISEEKSVFVVSLPSNTDVDAFIQDAKLKNLFSLGAVHVKDLKLYNSQTLTAFDNYDMKLCELSEDVGSISHPLVLTYVDRTIKVSLEEKIEFLESVVIPSFAPRLKFGSYEEKRSEWMTFKAEKYLTKAKADELMDRFSTVSTLEKAEEKLLEAKQERLQRLSAGGKLKDGFPELQQNLTLSLASVPSAFEHKPCDRNEMLLPFLPPVPEKVLNAASSIWEDVDTRSSDGVTFHSYSSEEDITFLVRRYLLNILLALNLPLKFSAEVTIKQIRPDLYVLLMGKFLVGVVAVKKPGENVLLEPIVLGELMDQMLLVEGFYGMGPVIGILTTAEEWLVSWFPVDSDALARVPTEDASFTTPMKQKSSSTSTETKGHSSPGGTPSKQSGITHSIDEVTDQVMGVSLEIDDGVTQEMDRLLCATRVMNIYKEPICVLQHLCGAFQLMSKAHLHHTANLSRCLLKFHKGIQAVTFHPMSYEDVHSKVDYDKYPSNNVKTLVALEDLGRGSTGKAWLCVTVTKPHSAPCVLKFDNKHSQSTKLMKEMDMWHLLYPEFASMVKIEMWSGDYALVMPHFSTVLDSERERYKDELREVLVSRFFKNGKVHRDVRWSNIGKYKNKRGAAALVVYDLYDVVDYDVNVHHDWIDKAMQSLFVHV